MQAPMKRLAFLLLLAPVVAHAGWTTRKIRLTNRLTIPQHPECMLSVSDLRISAPTQGRNVCEFADLWRTVDTVGSSGGGVRVTTRIDSGPYKRATFNYLLIEDSAPLFKDALKSLGVTVDPSSPLVSNVNATFAYFFTDPDRVFSASGPLKNELAIRMDLELVIKEQDRIVAKRAYTRTDAERYSTAWVTFPREATLNSLFNKALSNILSQIAGDTELQTAIKAR